MPKTDIREADLDTRDDQEAIVYLLDEYAKGLKGYETPLSQDVRARLIPGLQAMPTTLVFLAFAADTPVGVAVCFMGFSTFAAKPLVNIHDIAVLPEYRRQGIGTQLMEAVERKARTLGCCKVTLETHERNEAALALYTGCGYEGAILDKSEGRALFLVKTLT